MLYPIFDLCGVIVLWNRTVCLILELSLDIVKVMGAKVQRLEFLFPTLSDLSIFMRLS